MTQVTDSTSHSNAEIFQTNTQLTSAVVYNELSEYLNRTSVFLVISINRIRFNFQCILLYNFNL